MKNKEMDCGECEGLGYKCVCCENSEDSCECEEFDSNTCEDCKGTGKVNE